MVAQLQSQEARAWLDTADTITDGHLVREIEQATGKRKGMVGLKRVDGRVRLAGEGD